MDKIAILMSTYNGEKYLAEQLDSIVNQVNVQYELFIRDDGSKDSTPDIISTYEKKCANIHFINSEYRKNIGFNKSFFELISYAIINLPEYNLFAFADQDDVWFDTKLRRAIDIIEQSILNKGKSMDIPIYYYANKYWCNELLEPIHKDNFRYCKDDYFDMFMLPPVYGCTSVFNRALGELTIENLPGDDFLYDVYMFRLACTMDSILISDREPQMYYRRHGNNASGDAMKMSPFRHLLKLLKEGNTFHGMQNYLKEIYKFHYKDMQEDQRELCEAVLNYEKSLRSRMKLLTWQKAYERGLKASLIWLGRVLTKSI